jgi:hypothetical protein
VLHLPNPLRQLFRRRGIGLLEILPVYHHGCAFFWSTIFGFAHDHNAASLKKPDEKFGRNATVGPDISGGEILWHFLRLPIVV